MINPHENITGSPAGIGEQKKWEDQLMAVLNIVQITLQH